jgi:hypothetical protein
MKFELHPLRQHIQSYRERWTISASFLRTGKQAGADCWRAVWPFSVLIWPKQTFNYMAGTA